MIKKILVLTAFFVLIFSACMEKSSKKTALVSYPKTPKRPVESTFFETKVVDNYRWLEDDRSSETEQWVAAENEVNFKYISNIPYRVE